MLDLVIIGSGPAGLAAAIYGVRAGLNLIVIEKSPISGGQIVNTYEVDNYPGLPSISGIELGRKMREHADKVGATFTVENVKELSYDGSIHTVVTNKNTFEAKSVIIATGASHAKLGVHGEEELLGMGVSYCATCDGAFFKGMDVAVVGGGDVALEDAIFLARNCNKVYLIHRRDEFRGTMILQEEVKKTPNIEILYDTIVESINGEDGIKNVTISNKNTGECQEIDVNGIFIAVGINPNTDGIVGLPEMDEKGYIIAGEDCKTSIPLMYAVGDVRTKQLRQVITAAADGANAVTTLGRDLLG